MNAVPTFDEIPDPLLPAGLPRVVPQPPARLSAPTSFEVTPARRAVHRSRFLALGTSLVWLGGHLVAYGVRTDWSRLSSAYVALQIVPPFTLALVTSSVALRPGPLGLGLDVRRSALLAALAPLSFWLVALGASPPYAPAHDPQRWLHVLLCLDLTLTFTALPLLAAALCLRRAFAGAPRLHATLIGAGAGLLAGATMNLHCPNVDILHVALGHGLPVLAATACGAFVVAKVVRA